jgi:hypothetical protein
MNAAIAGAEQTRAARPIEILQAPLFLSHFLAFLATDVKVSQGNRTRSLSWRHVFWTRGGYILAKGLSLLRKAAKL